MRRAVSFADVLEETLAVGSSTATLSHPSYAAPQVLGFFDFSAPGRQPFASSRPYRPVVTPTARRLARSLSPAQRHALDQLIALGAPLGADFVDAELRAAFRDLARQYHPDRHPGSTDAEQARLSALFARAHAAYRVLRGVAARAD